MTDDPQAFPYPINALAEAFPPLPRARHAALVVRIGQYCFRPPIIVWRGEIIHGVALLQAYTEAEVGPRFEFLPDDADPLAILAAEAIPSQEMDDNARAVAGYRVSQWSTRGRPREQDEKYANLRNITQKEAAGFFGVSVRLVNYAAQVLSDDSRAALPLRQAVREWKVKVTDAVRILERSPEVQERAVELVTGGQVRTAKAAVERVEQEIAEAEEAEALADMLAKPFDEALILHTATVASLADRVAPESVDTIVTHPPYAEDVLLLLSDVADFAAHALKPVGCLIVVGQGILLPGMMEALNHSGLGWRWEADLLFRGKPAGSGRPYHVRLHRRPVLIYGKKGFWLKGGDDLIEVPADDELPPGLDRNDMAMELILKRFCRPGQVVCDPAMLNRAGAALAARKLGCRFVGATAAQSWRDRIHLRLASAEDLRNGSEGANGMDLPRIAV